MSDTESKTLYDELVSEYAGDLFALAFRLTGRREVAEDLVQETCTEAWRSLATLRDRASARGWLMQILRHRWLHWRRARSRSPVEESGLDMTTDRAAPGADPATISGSEELQEALDHLDERFREPLLMVFLQGMSCQEVAQELAIPLGTVLSRLHRARAALRRLVPARAPRLTRRDGPPLRLMRGDGEE